MGEIDLEDRDLLIIGSITYMVTTYRKTAYSKDDQYFMGLLNLATGNLDCTGVEYPVTIAEFRRSNGYDIKIVR